MDRIHAVFQRIDRIGKRLYALFAAALAVGCVYAAGNMLTGPERSGEDLAGGVLFGLGAVLTGSIAYRALSEASASKRDQDA